MRDCFVDLVGQEVHDGGRSCPGKAVAPERAASGLSMRDCLRLGFSEPRKGPRRCPEAPFPSPQTRTRAVPSFCLEGRETLKKVGRREQTRPN